MPRLTKLFVPLWMYAPTINRSKRHFTDHLVCLANSAFVDTNVVVYAHDADAGAKRDRAANVLRELWTERTGVFIPQVL